MIGKGVGGRLEASILREFLKTGRIVTAVIVLSAGLLVAAKLDLFSDTNVDASATSCVVPDASNADKVNIIYYGLHGSTTKELINSFQCYYDSNSSGHSHSSIGKDYHDIQKIAKWAGASDAKVAGMTTDNTKIGTLKQNGNILVSDKVVATDAWVSARFGAGQNGFKEITDGVYARKTTTSFAQPTAPVLVHFDKNGQVDFAVMIDCGNTVKVTPKPIPPKPPEPPKPPKPPVEPPKPPVEPPVVSTLTCNYLKAKADSDDKYSFGFSIDASANNTKIDSYNFDFGDGTSQKGTENTANHTYAKPGNYQVKASVAGLVKGEVTTVTSANCQTLIKIETPPPVKPEQSLTCDNLGVKSWDENPLKFRFSVTGTAKNTKIDSYNFDFGDGTNQKGSEATVYHTYAKPGNYDVKASVVGQVDGVDKQVSSENCLAEVNIKTPPPVKPEQSLTCDDLSAEKDSDNPNKFKFTVDATANNTEVSSYSYDFGDGTTLANSQSNTVYHEYAKAGSYDVKASVTAEVNGEAKTTSSNDCEAVVKIVEPTPPPVQPQPTPPQVKGESTVATELPNTGSTVGSAAGLFAIVVVAGTVGYQFILRKALGRR